MSLNRQSKLLLGLSSLWALLICALGAWWLYLIVTLGEKLEQMPFSEQRPNISAIVKWEGATFLILLVLLSVSLFFLYLKDQKKTKALQDFFASLTHELKTPLASIRLQAEVIRNILEQNDHEKLDTLSQRMIEDTRKLETQMDKILQLSRLERGGTLNLQPTNLENFLENFKKDLREEINLSINSDENLPLIQADEFALELIFRNLTDNTHFHSSHTSAYINITRRQEGEILLTYTDKGQFQGDRSKLGQLFYKHKSNKGSGIGIYLSKKLMKHMKGTLDFSFEPHFSISLSFRPQEIS